MSSDPATGTTSITATPAFSEPTDNVASSPSRCPTLVETASKPQYSALRKYVLLSIFCLAQFLDSFNGSALFSAIPTMEIVLGITQGESAWVISAWQLTFAAFLLMSGKISDVYNPKYVFVVGIGVLGILSLGTGFVNNKIILFILRGIGGVFGALTIPSSLTLIIQVFPEPKEQGRALGIFGGFSGLGAVLGLIIGAIFVQYASWRWVFWIATIAALPAAATGALLIPEQHREKGSSSNAASRLKRLDIPGVTALTAAIILFIYALTTATTSGWSSASVLAPLIISIAMVVAFFIWEYKLPADWAAIPSNTWFLPNFSVLIGSALVPFSWWVNVFTVFITLWTDVYQWSVISAAVHLLPIGASAFVVSFTGSLSRYISPKYVILGGQVMMMVGAILLAFADRQSRYWSHAFPGLIIGSGGTMMTVIHTNIAVFRSTPVTMAGTAGAILNSSLQLGAAVGLAVVTTIQASLDGTDIRAAKFTGRRAALWFTFAVTAVAFVATLVFLRIPPATSTTGSPDVEEQMSAETKVEHC